MKNVLVVAVVALQIVGCVASGHYGKFVQDSRVQNVFEHLQMPKSYAYYYNGPEKNPTAIIGIVKGFTVQSSFWHPVNLTKKQMSYWLGNIRTEWFDAVGANREGYANNGWRLIAPDGREAGILFSKYKRVVATFSADGIIGLSVPQPWAGSSRWHDE
ncbi:hypothetical protein [Desulfotalea psychrophila]|uniref:Uncharacterized protein n=1 Tax=Desulfotalea psychrophila (strain LSv54 / DSM 12343) TaxID=177439 RepID=Q6AQ63_DESPS|nr:hypothetical protein [Desulfotalea psychrophila]CAG35510.1 unknown protein [Desulfotalea psychrophila LSv54]